MQSSDPNFPSTHWSLVEAAQGGDEPEALEAMEELCRSYWYPIYAYLRRSGHAPADAEDLTQEFFYRLIGRNAILSANKELGRLRTYLLAVLKRLLSDHKRHRTALKRGGGRKLIPFDDIEAEGRYQTEPRELDCPAKLFDRAWARTLLADASAKLRESFIEGDNARAYDHLSEFLPLGDNARPYRKVAADMGIDEGVVRLQVHRMRKRYRGLVEQEIASTVRDPKEIDAELQHLMAAIGS